MKRLASIVLVPLFLARFGSAQTATPASPSVTKDATSVTLAQKALAAMGAAASYQDSVATGILTMTETKQDVAIQIKTKGLTEYRHDLQRDGGTFSYIVNGLDACILRPDGTKSQGVFQNSRGRGADYIPALSLLARYQESGVQVQYAGTASVNGSQSDVLALSYSPPSEPDPNLSYSVSQRLYFIDRTSGYVTKMQFSQFGENNPNGGIKTEVYFSDYRTVSGLAVPFQQVTNLEGTPHSQLVLSSVSVNTGLLDSDFALNCEVTNAH